MARPQNQVGGIVQTWPLPIATQAVYIDDACSAHGVPIQVFMGMYNNESGLGTNPNTGVGGPFQMTDSGTRATYSYPPTATPNTTEFARQADGAAHYLHDIYVDFVASAKSWLHALSGYNAGPGHYLYTSALDYAARALAFQIPKVWQDALAGHPGGGAARSGPAAPGGTAGAGGTGTLLNDSSGFRVGDPSNPDEDFWSAINRLAQERYWYCFSDGETLYLADGPDLMKQTPALEIDRVADMGSIGHLEFTWDNTAWQYSATHKKRKRSQRRTALAKVTSPVEGILNVICKIDEVRAGDVVSFDNCGPGDGQWLAGDVRRSVFEVLSEITVVPALTPLTEGQLNPAGTNQKNSVFASLLPGTGKGNYKGYVNPVGNWRPSRVDQGIDGTLSSSYLSPADSLIVSGPSGSWPGGSYLAGRILNGPLKGKVWYVAEGVTPLVPQGATVKAGTPVARPSTGLNGGSPSGLIETGWADPLLPHRPLSQSLPGYGGDQSPQALACGNSFNRFVVKLGGSPASIQGSGRGVAPAALPGNYP